ncbi:hypothetical protein OWR28_02470 [Chryseobacterium sp. 1B4]
MKLTSMTEFVLQHKGNTEFHMNDTVLKTGKLMQLFFKYAEFLNQYTTLGMFVPVDDHENVIVRPYPSKYGYHQSCSPEEQSGWMYDGGEDKYHEALRVWEKAKEKVLFEGFEIEDIGLGSIAIRKNGLIIMRCSKAVGATWENVNSYPNIESLVEFDIELTPSALKQIGL